MSRYAAALGIRNFTGSSSDPKVNPFVVVMGPSGQLTTIPGISGQAPAVQGSPNAFFGVFHSMSHVGLEWYRNELVTSALSQQNGDGYGYAWQPYGQQDTPTAKINDALYDYANNVQLRETMMFDGHNWKVIAFGTGGLRSSWASKRIEGGACLMTGLFNSAYLIPTSPLFYTGDDPVRTGNQGGTVAPSGWRPRSGLFGRPHKDVISCAHFELGVGNIVNAAGVRVPANNPGDQSQAIIDIAEHRGTIYAMTQFGIYAFRPGGKGQWLFTDSLGTDDYVNDVTATANYQQRIVSQVTGTTGRPRSLAVHNDRVFMLSSEGRFFEVFPNRVKQLADLTTLGTPWSSGVVGNVFPSEPSTADGGYNGTTARRPFLTSFNGQLHAFLNFESNFRLAKGVSDNLSASKTGRGVFWATSFDGSNWTDQSPNLPASGIHSPSGGGVVAGPPRQQVNNWTTFTAPYRFSGLTGPGAKPIPGASGVDYPSAYETTPIGGSSATAGPAQPSGFKQTSIPLWTSGNMIDPVTTPFGSLTVPLEYGVIGENGAFLFPTDVRYPADFRFQSAVSGGPLPEVDDGVLLPSGVGPSGWDYTGCSNYHVSGFVDEQKNKLQVYFSRDDDVGGTVFFELDQASGWNRRNYAPGTKQLNSFKPIMLYDPEVIIPSGTVFKPNPAVDEVNKRVTVKYKLYDWPFYDSVNVLFEYSTNYGRSWATIGTHKNRSTGSPATDPSGVIGVEHELVWNYQDTLGKNEWFPHVQIRARAIDPDFDPKAVSS